MTVGRICTREVAYAEPQETAKDGAFRMGELGVGTLIVLNTNRVPVGLVTDRDLTIRVMARGLDPATTPLSDVMTTDLRVISEQTPIEMALQKMRAGAIRRMPVVGDDGKLLGLLTLDDIVLLLVEEFASIGRLLQEQEPA